MPSKENLYKEIFGDEWNGKVVHHENKGNKISQVFLDYAAPLLEDYDGNHEADNIIPFAIITWNLSLLPEQERVKEIETILDKLCHMDMEARAFWNALIVKMLDRKTRYFSNDTRYIVNYQITYTKKQLHLTVAAAESEGSPNQDPVLLKQQSATGEIKDRYSISDQIESGKVIKVGPNDPCPCGSGQKYKKCCLNLVHPC